MWIVAKIKKQEINIFKKELSKKVGSDIVFYYPKTIYTKYSNNKLVKLHKPLIENYIFCYHQLFSCIKISNETKFIKGLQYFLEGNILCQTEIENFITKCKSFENDEGYLKPNFYKFIVNKKAEFVSGPFTNIVFEIIEKQNKKLKILVNDIVATISDNGNYFYRPI